MSHDLPHVANQFELPGRYLHGTPYGSGHINDTYAVTFEEQGRRVRYIFQRINHHVFKDVPALMDNVDRVTRHVRKKLQEADHPDIDRSTLTLMPTRSGACFLHDEDGLYWRVYLFIEQAKTYDIIKTNVHACEGARAFGQFQVQLADLPAPRLHETIPNFHHTRSRFDALVQAVEEDACGRLESARKEVDEALARQPMVDVLLDLKAAGEIPERITHNDTKLNNVMIDDASSAGICVIDLDTVMPGLALYDFGDMVRTATNTGAEDETDLARVEMNLDRFSALAQGYLSSTGDVLTAKEVELLPFAGKLITFETGLRFLTDYLAGDTYFKIHREGHNLDRCRTQFKLVESMEQLDANMHNILENL